MNEFQIEVRDKIIDRLGLQDVAVDQIEAETALFGQGLELDSIDALEIEALVAQEYGIVIMTSERTRSTFGSFGTLCEFIEQHRNRDRK